MGSEREEHNIDDLHKSIGEEETEPLVYRRRIRKLSFLPVRLRNSTEDQRVALFSNERMLSVTNASLHEDCKSRRRARPERDHNTLACQSLPTVSRIEVEPEVGKLLGRSHAQCYGVAMEPGPEQYLVGKIVHLASNSKVPPGEGESRLSGHSGRRSQLIKFLKRPSAENGCCPVDHLYACPRKVCDVRSNEEELNEGSDLDHSLLEHLNRSPFKSERKQNDNLVARVGDPSIFSSVPVNQVILPRKRRKVTDKDVRGGLISAASIRSGLPRTGSPLSENDMPEGHSSPGLRKMTRNLSSVPLKQTSAPSCERARGLVSISGEALGRQQYNVPRAAVSVDPFGTTNCSLDAVSIPVEGLGIPNSNLLTGIPVEDCGFQYSNVVSKSSSVNWNLVPGRVSVESLGILNCSQNSTKIPLETLGGPHSYPLPLPEEKAIDSLAQGKRGVLRVAAVKSFKDTKKDGSPAGRFKTRLGLGLLREKMDQSYDGPLQTPCRRRVIGGLEVVHPKILPEAKQNGVRRSRRMQFKPVAVEVHLPNVKSSCTGSQQMDSKEAFDSIVPIVPRRRAKSAKFLSLQQLGDAGNPNKSRARPKCVVIKEDEDNRPDQPTSDYFHEARERNVQYSSANASDHSYPPDVQELPPTSSGSLKARLGEEQLNMNQRIASYELNRDMQKRERAFSILKLSRGQLANVPSNVDGDSRGKELYVQMQGKRAEYSLETTETAVEGDDFSGTNLTTKTLLISADQAEEKATILPGKMSDELKLNVTSVKSLTREQMTGGGTEGSNEFLRMTPRTRKLTDAMQNFLQQKDSLPRQWKEMELGKIHPMALIGRSCKLYWPLDSAWYPGTIHEYNPQTRKHRIDYEDDEKEWVLLGKERVKLHVSAEESKSLETSFGEGFPVDKKKKLDADELGVLAADLEGCQGNLNHGDIVWAKVKGYPMWPAFVMDEEHASAASLESTPRERTLPVQFFGSYDYSRVNSKRVVPFANGVVLKYHTKCKRTEFEQGLQEIERYLKECKLPDPMAQLQEDAVVAHQSAYGIRGNEESNDGDLGLVKEETGLMQKVVDDACDFPLEIGGLRVLKLGKIVRDSERFHTHNDIWTDGYTAIRKFASTKDPKRIVEYKMEVLRNPIIPALPLFRVTPEDDKMVEASSPSGCWKRIFAKVRRAKAKAELSSATQFEKKRYSVRPGSQMFGFGNRRVSKLIQALPNARVCSKFTAWIEKPFLRDDAEELAPAGYQPVTVCWKHLDRCNICYLDEEYADNQLLQCDKCRIMVHMYCYGELEPPDGDLWLCNLCRLEAPRRTPFCCLCPVTGGAMKATTDGRWAHLTCAMWTPETCLVDVKKMEPVDGINSISKERWKLVCSVCKVPYGACIQCSKPHCRVAFHPLCARGAGLCMKVLEDKVSGNPDADGGLQLLTYCKRHSFAMGAALGGAMKPQFYETTEALQNYSVAKLTIPTLPQCNPSGCARSEAYNAASRRGHRQPEALAAALAKRYFVEDKPYIVTGCRRYVSDWKLKSVGVNLCYRPSKPPKPSILGGGDIALHGDDGQNMKAPQSTSERYRHMRLTMHDRLTFGKSSIHGWGVFTKISHNTGDMVIEYAGEILRPTIADIRERRSYDSLVGAGTYMFRIDDERVVDATHAGSIAHLINHSCEPNCYSRVVTAHGEDHIIIFAKRYIEEMEELTYDYRFASKDELLTCYCGCTGCRGFVNSFDADEDTRMTASRSELIKWVPL